MSKTILRVHVRRLTYNEIFFASPVKLNLGKYPRHICLVSNSAPENVVIQM